MNKAVGYIRVSTDKEKQANSLAAQPETIERYAAMQGLEVLDVLQDEVSALKVPFFERKSGIRIRELIKKGKVQHVIGAKVDRLFRDAQDGLATADWIQAQGVDLHVIDTGGVLNVGDPAGRMMFTMLLAVAEFEPRRISQRTKEALGVMRANGKKIGKVPYGYREIDGQLVEEPAEMAIVREVRERSGRGEKLNAIADDLNARKISVCNEGKMRKYRGVMSPVSGRWYASTVRNIVKRKEV